jgi:uroporphyrinogen decarboxylase
MRLVKQQSPVPVIGFCGGPYTVATYFETMSDELIDQLTDVSIEYVRGQIAAGADVIQIFDSWANKLDGPDFEKYSLQPLRKIIKAVNVPVIVFMRGSARRAEQIAQLGCAISIDSERPLADIRKRVALPLQGNLDPETFCLRTLLVTPPAPSWTPWARILLSSSTSATAFCRTHLSNLCMPSSK